MSDDWQVVEEALEELRPYDIKGRHGESLAALARLREREAQLRADSADTYARERAAEARVAELQEEVLFLCSDEDDIRKGLRARVARLEEALREIADGSWGAQAQHVRYDVCEFARRALAHEEKK